MAFKRTKPVATSNVDDVSIELDKKKQVTVRKFNGINLIDIREFYEDKETGEKKPGKKGISLTEETWFKLLESRDKIQSALDDLNEEPELKKVKVNPNSNESDPSTKEGSSDEPLKKEGNDE